MSGNLGGGVSGPVLPPAAGLRAAEERMRRVLEVARAAPPQDVPIAAAVFSDDGRLLAAAANRREADGDPTAHAEILALRAAASVRGDGWRLTGTTLVVTAEPCAMCAGALLAARVAAVEFGAFEPKTGACGSVVDLLRESYTERVVAVRGGVLERECAALLEEFFARRR